MLQALPFIVLAWTAIGLVLSVGLGAMVGLAILPVPWDAAVLPGVTLFGLIPYCFAGLVLACVSAILHRDWRSMTAMAVGLLAVLASGGALFLIVAIGMANHPI